ncbi:inositol monophosphatase family protein [Halomarina rubra]|uniref:fructose-bisphosphatase n=1 Tax=Halomarina rubra TaxID=2071873 RepID=A0ABD6AYU2_9EURY
MLPAIEDTAVRATFAGGRLLRERFRANDADGEFDAHDVKAAADRASEERMLSVVESSFPDHTVYAEERGERAGETSEYRWVVDPLDGTNNYVAGMPSFAASVAVLDADGPVLASVYAPVADDHYLARRGVGTRYDGTPVDCESDRSLETATVGFVIGHDVKRDGRLAEADALRDTLADSSKRVFSSWSPTVHWGLLARGRIDAMVTFAPDEEEQHAGELLANEAGAHVRRDDTRDLGVFAASGSLADALAERLAVV